MSLDGVLTKEFIFAEFKKCETNADKVKYLKELKETKIRIAIKIIKSLLFNLNLSSINFIII